MQGLDAWMQGLDVWMMQGLDAWIQGLDAVEVDPQLTGGVLDLGGSRTGEWGFK